MTVSQGKFVIAVAKSLKRFQAGDPQISAYMHASSFAGRAGLYAAAMRSQSIEWANAVALGASEGINSYELKTVVLPWLEESGQVVVKRSGDTVLNIKSVVLNYSNILTSTYKLFEKRDPSNVERACLQLMQMASDLPVTESEAKNNITQSFAEQDANLAITLSKSYRLLEYREGRGLSEPVLYSPSVWKDSINNAARHLSFLNTTDRAVLLELIRMVREYQGMPRAQLLAFAAENNASHLLNIAIGTKLIHETVIEMNGGENRAFLTTPHFYEEVASEHGEDACDRLKIFLDSIRNGQHFGDAGTGRISSPVLLLRRLLNNGTIGPCTAIGTDYVTSEKAGIVTVSGRIGSRCYLNLVQRDTVEKVLEVVERGKLEGNPMTESHVQEGNRFRSIEECTPELAAVPENIAEAERAIIQQLREG